MTDPASVDVRVFADGEELARAAADLIATELSAAVAANGRASLVLAGGSTPRAAYRELAIRPVEWESVDLWTGDERCVPPEDPGSNAAMIRDSLLEPAGIAFDRLQRMRGELGAVAAVDDYEQRLRERFPESRPAFDLLLLGLGGDGHTASLFPGGESGASDAWVAATRSPVPPLERVSLTYRALAGAARTLFLVAGEAKASMVSRILSSRSVDLPAARVAREAQAPLWLLDRAAATRL